MRVLLLHGLASSRRVWDTFAHAAASPLELWDAELPWYSEGDQGWTGIPGRDWVAQAIRMVEGGPDVVVAHSFAANALLALLDREGSCGLGAAVLVSPFYRPRTEDFDWAMLSHYLNDFHLMIEEGVHVQGAGRLSPGLARDIALRIRDRIGPYGWIRFLEAYLSTPELDTARLRPPFLIVSGDHDPAALRSDGEALAMRLPRCRLEIVQPCGHFPMLERPEEFTSLVEAFIASVFPECRIPARSRQSTKESR